MKKLRKLSINSEKLIKNGELVNLRGGYGDTAYCCCWDAYPNICSACVVGADPNSCVQGSHAVAC